MSDAVRHVLFSAPPLDSSDFMEWKGALVFQSDLHMILPSYFNCFSMEMIFGSTWRSLMITFLRSFITINDSHSSKQISISGSALFSKLERGQKGLGILILELDRYPISDIF